MKASTDQVPGTGLPPVAYAAILGASVVLFLVWGGALWNAPRGTSHVARFAVSYLTVIPLSALALLALRRLRWSYVVTTTATIWSLKLLITAVLYVAFVRGGIARGPEADNRPPVARHAASAPPPDYEPARAAFAAGAIEGRVVLAGAPALGAIVFVDQPAPGRPLGPPETVKITVSGSRYDAPLYLAHAGDELLADNRDPLLHTVHIHAAGHAPTNQPVPPSPTPRALRVPEPGVYRMSCDTHPTENAWLVVVDHPYAARADREGAFRIDSLPAGDVALRAIRFDATSGQLSRASSRVHVEPGAPVAATLALEIRTGRPDEDSRW